MKLIEEVLSKDNLNEAYKQVVRKKCAINQRKGVQRVQRNN